MRHITRAAGIVILAIPLVAFGAERQENPREFAIALARSGISGGLILPKSRLNAPSEEAVAEGVRRGETLDSTLAQFNASHPGVRASARAGVVRVHETEVPAVVLEALARSVYVAPVDEISVWEAVFVKTVGLIAGREPQGFAGTGVGTSVGCPMNRRIRLPNEPTIERVLDGIVRQVPGLMWVVTYSEESPLETLEVGIICADGQGQLATVSF